MVTSEKYMCN